ncbi:hypothetical protein EDC19_2605 [Natranaerovirga hydrolytica]|uniref:Uncharacterized protein n=1 Tax=Natranaerovirga hydrolytica TaxID=680378 RepID=A0A4R1M6R7_9FIRM|nr:hypothetical protein [Natranaerovirga hydrolytica]TCK87958.1 hypothetical protein EDC19_2605 [Natranaerovirga hydrolytica]
MMINKDARQCLDLSYSSLKEVKSYLQNAREIIEEQEIKTNIDNRLDEVNQLITNCETLSKDYYKNMQ